MRVKYRVYLVYGMLYLAAFVMVLVAYVFLGVLPDFSVNFLATDFMSYVWLILAGIFSVSWGIGAAWVSTKIRRAKRAIVQSPPPIVAFLVGPVVEEIISRYITFRVVYLVWLRGMFLNFIAGLIFSSMFFAVLHLKTIKEWARSRKLNIWYELWAFLECFVSGILLGLYYWYVGFSVVGPILLHIWINICDELFTLILS
ncbi:MAG: CPBP family glutamic-type intramembrane protease [Candidatus Odinarchaeia archaeon]